MLQGGCGEYALWRFLRARALTCSGSAASPLGPGESSRADAPGRSQVSDDTRNLFLTFSCGTGTGDRVGDDRTHHPSHSSRRHLTRSTRVGSRNLLRQSFPVCSPHRDSCGKCTRCCGPRLWPPRTMGLCRENEVTFEAFCQGSERWRLPADANRNASSPSGGDAWSFESVSSRTAGQADPLPLPDRMVPEPLVLAYLRPGLLPRREQAEGTANEIQSADVETNAVNGDGSTTRALHTNAFVCICAAPAPPKAPAGPPGARAQTR